MDACEEPKMPQTSAAEQPKTETEDVEAELRKLRADKREQARKVGKLESTVEDKTKAATLLAEHVKQDVERDISQQKKTMESLAAAGDAIANLAKIEIEPMKAGAFVIPKPNFDEPNFMGMLTDAMKERISELESLIKQLAKTAGVTVDENKKEWEYMAELTQQAADNILRMKE
ncbi:uncharacterized protein J3D65DRAFT_668234 [Phyllosticta citribraziliensis]|uniref:Uncharacterized protein n=1 Tax=Phyllosticta citribraziliensis TaxID=989973 RepID=A0ABR1LKL7_9PEZI